MTKMYNPTVLGSIVECLRTVYWYEEDLKSFLTRAGVPQDILIILPWGTKTYKRTIARLLMDNLASEPVRGKLVVDMLIDSLVEMDEKLPHLAHVVDGKKLIKDGREALRKLKDLIGNQGIADRAERARQEKRTESERIRDQRVQREKDLKVLNERFLKMCSIDESDPKACQKRGFDFQKLLRDLFALHDLNPRGSFASPGEQVDGSISLDNNFILIEAKWEKDQSEPGDIRNFEGVLRNKLDNTLGFMISMRGFTKDAIQAAERSGRIVVLLVDGKDIAQVFQGLVDLTELLRGKLRHAADYGRAMYHFGD